MKNNLNKLFDCASYIFSTLTISLLSMVVCRQVFAGIPQNYQFYHNLVYKTVNNYELKLDLYENKKQGLHPTVIVIHGGGWIKGTKEELPFFAPYLDWGFSVVNIDYRVASTALAPAAVEDSLCALNWVFMNGQKYHFDPNRIVVTGFSAGGHLALTTAIIPTTAGFGKQCLGDEKLKVAAIVNWSGITDVRDLLSGPHQKYFAVQWFGDTIDANTIDLAKKLSPINYVRPGLPPILTIHGEKDRFVPYNQAIRLNQALDEVGVSNQLYTVRGASHGGYSKQQKQDIYATIKRFLIKQGVISSGS